jgi:hypothetical protein
MQRDKPALPPRHLLTLWNPAYAADALDEHVRLLVDFAERAREGPPRPGGRLRLVGQAAFSEPGWSAAAPCPGDVA